MVRPRHRPVSTLPGNPQIYVHRNPDNSYLLSLLPSEPPTAQLALGSTSSIPPTPATFAENKLFFPLLQSVLKKHAADDPTVQAEAVTFASPGGSMIFVARKKRGTPSSRAGTGAGAANTQGGAGGAGAVGWLHVHDERNLPPYGRIPDPEDIFGSVEVDGDGKVIRGTWEECTAYRLITREGMMRLSEFLHGKVAEALSAEEARVKGGR